MSEGMIHWNPQQEKHYLAQLICDESSDVHCGDFKHLIRCRQLLATAQAPRTVGQIIEDFTVPAGQCWLVTYAGVRSDGLAADFTTATDLESDSDLSPIEASQDQLAQWIVNGAAKTPVCPRTGIINAPYLLVFNSGERVQLLINAGITSQRVVLNTRINSYLVPSKIGSLFTAHQTIIESDIEGLTGCVIARVGSLLLGGVSSRTTDIAVDALLNNAYITTFDVGDTTGFKSYNISNKAVPVFQGALAAAANHNFFTLLLIDGTTVFAAGTFSDFAADVTAIDVTNPLVPARLSSLGRGFPFGQITGLSLVGTTLYIVDGSPALSLIDVTLPAAMVTLADYNLAGPPFFQSGGVQRIVVLGTTAYILSYDTGGPAARFGIYDVTVPAAVTQTSLTTVAVPAAVSRRSGLQVVGTRAYVLSDNHFVIVDVSVPAAPVILSQTAVAGDTVSTLVQDQTPLFVNAAATRAFILNDQSRSMSVYDITDPTAPFLISTFATQATSSPSAVIGSGSFLFLVESAEPVGSTQSFLEIVNVSGCA